MTSRASFFNPALLKKNTTRCMPLWVLFFVGLFMLLPLPLMVAEFPSNMGEEYFALGTCGGVFINQFYALLCACCCFGYLHKTRSAYMLHAMPVTRNSLFLTNFTSGLLFALVPYLAILLISACVSRGMSQTLLTFAVMMLQFVFYYGLAVFCMMLSGTTAAGAVLYFLLNYLVAILGSLILAVAQPMICGLRYAGTGYLRFSPAVYFLYNEIGELPVRWGYLLATAGAGVVLSVCAWLMYRRRRLETAGDVIAYETAKPIAKYLFTLLSSLTLGLLLQLIVFGDIDGSRRGMVGLIICLLIGGLLGCLGAEMLLKKSLRVFRGKTFLGFAVYALVLTVCLVGLSSDWLGFEKYMPAASEVQSVSIDMDEEDTIILTQPEDIQQVLQIHESLRQREKQPKESDKWAEGTVNITYQLKSGKKVYRQYEIYTSWFNGTDASAKALKELYKRKDLTLDYFERTGLMDAEYVYLPSGSVLTGGQIDALADCIREDVEAGRLTVYSMVYGSESSFWVDFQGSDSSTYGSLEIPYSARSTIEYLEKHDVGDEEDTEYAG